MSNRTDLDSFQIRNDVIGSIAAAAASEVQGVIGVWRGRSPFLSWMGYRAVKVETRDQEAKVWLRLNVEYGVHLPTVATQVQESVRAMIERMTNLQATEVHVAIHHVQVKGE